MTDVVQITKGDAPLLVSIPHTGTEIPPDIEAELVVVRTRDGMARVARYTLKEAPEQLRLAV